MPERRKDSEGNEILTAKEKEFCLQYSICRNGTQAAIKAGYSKETAQEIASQKLLKVIIKDEIDRLNGNFEEVAASMGVTKANILKIQLDFVNTDLPDCFESWVTRKELNTLTVEQRRCILEIESKVEYKVFNEDNKKGKRKIEWVKVRWIDKQKALESINKMLGFNAPEKREITGGLNITWNEEKTYPDPQ
jgi:phage terminase small subunit